MQEDTRPRVDRIPHGDALRDSRRLLARQRLECRVDVGVQWRPEPSDELLVLPSVGDDARRGGLPSAMKNRSAPREPAKLAKLSLNTALPGA